MNGTEEKKAAQVMSAYRIYEKMLLCGEGMSSCDRVLLRMRMREIENLLGDLPVGDARLLLELHYLRGCSVERCAERLGISRATAFRLKRRGLALVAARKNRMARHA